MAAPRRRLGGSRASCGSLGNRGANRPVAAVGGQETALFTRPRGMAGQLLRIDKMLRAKFCQSRWAAVGPQYRRVRSHPLPAKPCAKPPRSSATPAVRYALQPGGAVGR